MENSSFDDDLGNDFDLKAILEKYTRHWQWFLLAVCICLFKVYYTAIYCDSNDPRQR
jgi:tyrosine-protein kinase Etk/Wzc